jgi:hypothetical protein
METLEMMKEIDPTSVTSVAGGDAATGTTSDIAAVAFPGLAWFQRLADLMNENRARQEQLGYVDCVAGFRVLDGPGDKPRIFEVTSRSSRHRRARRRH